MIFFLKNGWHLDPNTNPDIFSIGSKWNYTSKKVTFITDIDSISFNVEPNRKYDFIVLLNKKTPCHIQIATSANPYFMQLKILIPIAIIFLIVIFLLIRNSNRLPIYNFLRFGFISPIIFWLTTFISGKIHGNYLHMKNVISELGAIGTKSELFTSSIFVITAIFCILFSFGFFNASKKLKLSVFPAIFSFSIAISFLWAGIFTLGNEFHNLIGPVPIFLIIGALLSYLLWHKRDSTKKIRQASLLSFLTMLLLVLRFFEPFGIEYEGLIQRLLCKCPLKPLRLKIE